MSQPLIPARKSKCSHPSASRSARSTYCFRTKSCEPTTKPKQCPPTSQCQLSWQRVADVNINATAVFGTLWKIHSEQLWPPGWNEGWLTAWSTLCPETCFLGRRSVNMIGLGKSCANGKTDPYGPGGSQRGAHARGQHGGSNMPSFH